MKRDVLDHVGSSLAARNILAEWRGRNPHAGLAGTGRKKAASPKGTMGARARAVGRGRCGRGAGVRRFNNRCDFQSRLDLDQPTIIRNPRSRSRAA
jgi:hypothetical protein